MEVGASPTIRRSAEAWQGHLLVALDEAKPAVSSHPVVQRGCEREKHEGPKVAHEEARGCEEHVRVEGEALLDAHAVAELSQLRERPKLEGNRQEEEDTEAQAAPKG